MDYSSQAVLSVWVSFVFVSVGMCSSRKHLLNFDRDKT